MIANNPLKKYRSGVLTGNWFEDTVAASNELAWFSKDKWSSSASAAAASTQQHRHTDPKLVEYLRRKSYAETHVPLSLPSGGYLHYGQTIQLVPALSSSAPGSLPLTERAHSPQVPVLDPRNVRGVAAVRTDPIDSDLGREYAVVESRRTQASLRTAFRILRVKSAPARQVGQRHGRGTGRRLRGMMPGRDDEEVQAKQGEDHQEAGDDEEGGVVMFGDRFHIATCEGALDRIHYVKTWPLPISGVPDTYFTQQLVRLSPYPDRDSIWQALPIPLPQRLPALGSRTPVPTDAYVLINHVATNTHLSATRVDGSAGWGVKDEEKARTVSAHRALDVHLAEGAANYWGFMASEVS